MRKVLIGVAALAAAICVGATPANATGTTYNTCPTAALNYGTGNNYTPCNMAVLTTTNGSQLGLRDHVTFNAAPASDNTGTYFFPAGATPDSYDWIITNASGTLQNISALLTLFDVGTGQSISYDPLNATGNDNYLGIAGTAENSGRFNWFMTPNANDTLTATLQVFGLADGNQTLTTTMVLGTGAAPRGVPEPSTWAMMLLGFGAIGFSLRRSRGHNLKLQQAA